MWILKLWVKINFIELNMVAYMPSQVKKIPGNNCAQAGAGKGGRGG